MADWIDTSQESVIIYSKLENLLNYEQYPVAMIKTLVIKKDLTWSVHVHGKKVRSEQSKLLRTIPPVLTSVADLQRVIDVLSHSSICIGNPHKDFISMCKARGGDFKSRGGNEVVSYLEEGYPIASGTDTETVRHSNCHFFTYSRQCLVCEQYKSNLRSMHRNFTQNKVSQPHKNTNIRFLKPTQKAKRMKLLQQQLRRKHQRVLLLQKRVNTLTEKAGVHADDDLASDITMAIDKTHPDMLKLPAHDFRRVFWEQQVYYYHTYTI